MAKKKPTTVKRSGGRAAGRSAPARPAAKRASSASTRASSASRSGRDEQRGKGDKRAAGQAKGASNDLRKPGAAASPKGAMPKPGKSNRAPAPAPAANSASVKGKAGAAAQSPDGPVKGRSGSRRAQAGAEAPAAPVADADGYVYLNGRRVRMISTKGLVTRKSRSRTSAAAAAAAAAEAAAKPVKTKLSRKELNHYRDLLVLKRAQLVGDLSAMEAQALQSGGGDLSHMPIHMADIGTDTYDQDFMLSMAEGERERIREIDAALQRIGDGTYGVCQKTGKPIPKARLDAKPWARHTVEAARQFELGRGA